MSASATKKSSWGNRLHQGEVSYDFIGKQKRWYMVSGALIAISVISLLTLGLKFSLDFTGGSQFSVKSNSMTVEQARSAVATAAPSVKDPIILIQTGGISGRQVVVKTSTITNDVSKNIRNELGKDASIDPNTVTVSSVSGSWGGQITHQAVTGLIIFMILVSAYLAIFYEWKMALAGLIALVHDLLITAGIYSLVGFEVSPATVIGFLTILGYSLYDTVVVFDKVKENTNGLGTTGRRDLTYTQAANLAVNQTLIRSLNTSFIALMPVAALLFAGLMTGGAGVLQDLALALLVGIAVGTYSSIFIATPLLADMKEREPDLRTLAKRVAKAKAEGRSADGRAVPTQDRIPAGFTVTEVDAANPPSATQRGPRNQPVRGDRSRNRPSGKKR